ncbi:MAG: cytidine deaminase [Bacteroidetes bacterium QS_9_68_14]|nr:MAG: cytidine deaminase [Bacteroidetes bacterium QS_9_68_14]
MSIAAPLASLRDEAQAVARRAHVPFSGRPAAAALLLADGAWVPGVRVESAAFSLTIPPALNAFSTAVAAERGDVVALAMSRPAGPTERAFWASGPAGVAPLEPAAEDVLVAGDESLPALGNALDPLLPGAPPATAPDGVQRARTVARRALVPASRFQVGCVLALPGGALVPGANVEPLLEADPTDWLRVLCAERCALGTACSYGLFEESESGSYEAGNASAALPGDGPALYLSCPHDPEGSPCGACRQLLVELLPDGVLWMDRAALGAPKRTSPSALLPGSFQGAALSKSVPSG